MPLARSLSLSWCALPFVAVAAVLLGIEATEARGLLQQDQEPDGDDGSARTTVPWDYPTSSARAEGAETPTSWEQRVVAELVEEYEVIVEHPLRTRAGRVVASGLLLAFIFFFGCCWDDQEGLPPDMASRLMQEDLWSNQGQAFSKKRVAVAPSSSCTDGCPDEDTAARLELCKAFIVPSSSTKLSVPIVQWQGEKPWLIDVLGFMGAPLLVARMRLQAPTDRRILEVLAPGGDDVALATASLSDDRVVIRGSGGVEFGELAGDGCGRNIVLLDNRTALAVTADSDGTPVAITSVPGSKQLATAVLRGRSAGIAAEHFEFTVRPGADLVLILVCILASQVFGQRESRCIPTLCL